jgi:hypothetical protein
MESQQIVELLLSMQAKIDAETEAIRAETKAIQAKTKAMREDMKADHEEMMAMLGACHKRMMACLGKMEADTEKPNPDPGMMQSTEAHQEIPKGEAAVMPVGELRKQHRVRNLAAECRQKQKERIEQLVSPRGDQPSPPGRCSAVQKWHGEKGTSSGLFRPKEIVDRERDWSSPA